MKDIIENNIREPRIVCTIPTEIFDRYKEMFKTDINALYDTELVNNYIKLVNTQNEILNKYYEEKYK